MYRLYYKLHYSKNNVSDTKNKIETMWKKVEEEMPNRQFKDYEVIVDGETSKIRLF